MAKGKNTVTLVSEVVQPVADEMGLILWDVRFEKEGASWYLRLFIDKEGGVNIEDCENFSRAVDKLLDEADPIDQSYYLEVGSPGIERELVKDWHFKQYIGKAVNVRFIRPVEGQKDFVGQLTAYENNEITILLDEDLEMQIPLAETAYVRLYDDFDMGGLD
ncbi:ribosome maturation factor RimP [Hydrogenoanaerobacterium sp.]|uniref:ribosome maturation factor RimP n=1 Tax=Hydrogenoanaerobacterium sp. TaxID=2953763 RepID=UPI002899C944|nr:ribosome maturation factor RimP [Hydrogenoanaerobacterium sp.]